MTQLWPMRSKQKSAEGDSRESFCFPGASEKLAHANPPPLPALNKDVRPEVLVAVCDPRGSQMFALNLEVTWLLPTSRFLLM